MKVVNLFSGPGAGKSSLSAGVFHNLKAKGINAELVGEFAKDLTWSKRVDDLNDSFYVFGEQHHRLHRLRHDVDVVITDSPLLLSLAYINGYPESFSNTIIWAFNQFNNLNFFLERTKEYNPKGRNQTFDEAKQKDIEVWTILSQTKTPFWRVKGNEEGTEAITEKVLTWLKS